MTTPEGGWAVQLGVVPTQRHFLKKSILGALNCKTHPPGLYKPPMPPFSLPGNSTIHWLKSCRKKGNKEWVSLCNNFVPMETVSSWEGWWYVHPVGAQI